MKQEIARCGVVSFDEEKHLYTLDGVAIPYVTQIIKATVGIAWEADEWYLNRGRAVHACAEMVARGVSFECDERIRGHVEALRAWFRDNWPIVHLCEQPMASRLYQFGARPDLIATLGKDLVVVDWKNSLDRERALLQLGAYAIAAAESAGFDITKGLAVELSETGKYRQTGLMDLRRARNEFLALRTTYAIRERVGANKKEQ